MQAAGCAAAALAAVERKLSVEGVAAGSMLVWCAGAGEARAMAAATDAVVPLGTYDLTVASELGVAQAVLRAADSPLGVAPHFPVPPAAASALVHRVLAAAPPSTLRPPNDPFKYQAEVERALFTLRYHGVPPAAWEAFCATLPPGRGASQRDLAAIYAAAAAQVAAYHTYDHADVVAAAVRVVAGNAEVAAAVREEWPQALLVGAHHFSRPAVALARRLSGAARRPPLVFVGPTMRLAPRGYPLPALAAASAAAAHAGAPVWQVHRVDEAAYGSAPLVVHFADAAAGEGAAAARDPPPSPPAHTITNEYGVWRGAATWVQGAAAAAGGSGGASFVAAAKVANAGTGGAVPSTAALVASLLSTDVSSAGAGGELGVSIAAAVRQAHTVGVVAKSAAHAAALTYALADALNVNAEGHTPSGTASPVRLVSDYATKLRDLPVIRTLLAVLGVLAQPSDAQAVFALASSAPYNLPHADLQPLLRAHRVGGGATPVWTWLQACADARSGGASRDPRRRARAAAAAATEPPPLAKFVGWDASPLSPQPTSMHTPPALSGGSALVPLPPPLARAVADVAAADDAYARTGSVASALVAFLRKSGLQHRLLRPSDLAHATASDAVAALLRIVSGLETDPPRGAPPSATAAQPGARAPVAGLPFVLEYLVRAVHEEGASFRTSDRGGGEAADALDSLEWLARVDPGSAGSDDGGAGSSTLALEAGDAIAARHRGGVSRGTPPTDGGLRTVVVTTVARALNQRFDVAIIAGATDAAFPGSDATSVVEVPPGVLATAEELGGTVTPTSPTGAKRAAREAHVETAARRLRAVMLRARTGVLLLVPPAAGRRSRFIDHMFGLPPSVSSLSSSSSALPPPPPVQAPPPPPPQTPAPAPELLPLSFSRMSDFTWCPHRHHLTRTVGIRVPPTPVLLYGRALHASTAACADAVLHSLDAALVAQPVRFYDGDLLPHPWHRVASLTGVATALLRGADDPRAAAAQAWARAAAAALPSERACVDAMLGAYTDAWQHGRSHATLAEALAADDEGDAALHADALAAIPTRQAEELYAAARTAAAATAARELAGVRAALTGGGTLQLPVLIEHSFRLPLPAAGVELIGVIDRVDLRAVRDGTRVTLTPVIREFKSGQQWRAAGTLEARARGDNLQAALYATALRGLLASAAPDVAGRLGAATAAFESIETGEAVDVPPGAVGGSDAVLAAITAAADGIRRGVSTPTPSPLKCGFCRFARVCAHAHGVHAPLTAATATSTTATVRMA